MEWAFHTTVTSNLLTFLPSSCTIASFDCDMCPLLMTPPPKWAFSKVKRWNGGTDPDFWVLQLLFHFIPFFASFFYLVQDHILVELNKKHFIPNGLQHFDEANSAGWSMSIPPSWMKVAKGTDMVTVGITHDASEMSTTCVLHNKYWGNLLWYPFGPYLQVLEGSDFGFGTVALVEFTIVSC